MVQGNLGLIIDDIKTSWYFRIWTAVWIVCAIVAFVALGELSNSSVQAREKPGWRIWIERKSQNNYPDFVITLLPHENLTGDAMNAVDCFFGPTGVPVPQTTCPGNTPLSVCRVVQGTTFFAKDTDESTFYPVSYNRDAIYCGINLTANNNTVDDRVVAVAIVGENKPTPEFISPNKVGELRIEQEILDFRGGKSEVHYSTQLGWVDNVSPFYTMGVIMRYSHLRVLHFEETNYFNGWMGIGAIGGFAFFMYLLHTLFMFFVGICVPNTSKFLNGQSDNGYSNLGK